MSNPKTKQQNIPKGWAEKKLGKVLTVGSGKDHKHLDSGDIPVFGTGGYMRSVDKILHNGETVFIGRKGTINKPFYFKGAFWTVDTLFYTYDYRETTARYIDYVFQKVNWLKYNEASGVPSLSKTTIEKIPFNFPPEVEQNKIISVLETWDQAIRGLKRKIVIKKEVKKGLMQELLTGKTRLAGFKGSWHTHIINELGKTYSGLTGKSKDDFGKGRLFISYMNIYSNSKINLEGVSNRVQIETTDSQNTAMYGDLFFTTSSETPEEVGISSVLLCNTKEDVYLNSFCFGFRLKDFKILTPEFSQFYFRGQTFRKQMFRIAQGASRFNLSKKYFLETDLLLPSIEEQKSIAELLAAADSEIEQLNKKLNYLNDQKKFLLNNLITGTIRTPETLSIAK